MASQQEKAFCVLRFEVSRSVITVHETHAALYISSLSVAKPTFIPVLQAAIFFRRTTFADCRNFVIISRSIETAVADKAVWNLWYTYSIKFFENLKLTCFQIKYKESNQLHSNKSLMADCGWQRLNSGAMVVCSSGFDVIHMSGGSVVFIYLTPSKGKFFHEGKCLEKL